MTLSRFFEFLGAPLANSRWSWGAERSSDKAIFLRVWQDEYRIIDGRRYVLIGYIRDEQERREDKAGRRERREHIRLIESGAKSYLVMCRAENVAAVPRTIIGFDQTDIFVGGSLRKEGDAYWLEIVDRKPARAVAA